MVPRMPTLPPPSIPVDAPWTVLLASVDPEATSVMVKGLVPARYTCLLYTSDAADEDISV